MPEDAVRMGAGIRAIPGLLEQARRNLVGNQKDLWTYGTQEIRQQGLALAELESRLDGTGTDLKPDVQRARRATEDFANWLDSQAGSKTAPSGIGVENYDWYLKNVQLAPYSWREEVALMERELARAWAGLAL